MARAKRGQRVWQCGVCGYWSERKRNAIRHNESIHAGAAPLVEAYATLVVEPSYRVLPISPLPFQAQATSSVVAQDTRAIINNSGDKRTDIGRSLSNVISVEAEKPFDAVEAGISFFQKHSKFIEEGNRLMRLIQQAAGGGVGGAAEFFNSPLSVPMQNATAMPLTQQRQQQHVPNTIGYSGNICSKCFNGIISPVPETERPDTFQQKLVELPHNCKGEGSLLFLSEGEVSKRLSKSIEMLEDGLFNQVKDWARGKKIVLEAKKLNYSPQHPHHLITANAVPEARRLLSIVQEAGGRMPFNGDDETLHTFLRWCHSSIVIIGTSTGNEDSEGSAQEYYSLSIQAQDKEEESPAMKVSTTMNIAPKTTITTTPATTNANVSSNFTNIAANNNDRKCSINIEKWIESLREIPYQIDQIGRTTPPNDTPLRSKGAGR